MSQIPYLKRFLLSIVPAFLISSALTSCNDDDGIDGPVEMQLWDIVTYEGKGNDGQGSVFTLRQVDDSPLVTLTSNLGLQDLEAPTRLMIRYIPEGGQAYVSDRIQLLGASKINTGEAATEWKEDYDKWNRDKVFLYSAWRTGTYINFHLRLTYSNDPRIFNLVLDPATRESETPEFYLVHIMAEETDYHDRAYFASFDIGEIWNAPGIKGVKIHIADTNLNKDVFTFYKNN
ncbi:NigD-like C-terminal domain-containing protein [uncultured Duncaniella sp.]|uniref:NigD1/NigD2 family lipoprotein n=1 Tax=uncultured Duncaniella sp. TaxID=2768039 RepID=UPI0025A98743|nr:NigD-like C-terminal domain-containing protein [uncultured Duncaniella sp.]